MKGVKKMKLKLATKFLALFLALVLSLSGVVAFADEGDWTTRPVTLSLWHNSDRVEYVETVEKYYKELYPNVTLNHSYYTSAELKTNIPIAAASGTLPDVFLKPNGAICKSLSDAGKAMDLTPIAERDNWNDKYFSWVLDQDRVEGNGKLSQLDFFYQVFACLYRTDVLETIGGEIPSTMAEFEALCDLALEKGYIPIALGGSSGTHVLRLWSSLLEMYAGSDLLDSLFALESNWNNEAVINTFYKLKKWYDKGYFSEGFLTYGPNDARILLYTGKALLTFDSASIFGNIRRDFGTVEQYDFFQLPRDEGSGGTRLFSDLQGYMLNSQISDDQLNAAIQWLYMWDSQEIEEIHDKAIIWSIQKDSVLQDWAVTATNSITKIVEENGTTANYDIQLPEEIYNTLADVNEQVLLGTISAADAASTIQKVIDEYQA